MAGVASLQKSFSLAGLSAAYGRLLGPKSLVISPSFMPALRPILDRSRFTGGSHDTLFEGARAREA